jgi:hypothetical protein
LNPSLLNADKKPSENKKKKIQLKKRMPEADLKDPKDNINGESRRNPETQLVNNEKREANIFSNSLSSEGVLPKKSFNALTVLRNSELK